MFLSNNNVEVYLTLELFLSCGWEPTRMVGSSDYHLSSNDYQLIWVIC